MTHHQDCGCDGGDTWATVTVAVMLAIPGLGTVTVVVLEAVSLCVPPYYTSKCTHPSTGSSRSVWSIGCSPTCSPTCPSRATNLYALHARAHEWRERVGPRSAKHTPPHHYFPNTTVPSCNGSIVVRPNDHYGGRILHPLPIVTVVTALRCQQFSTRASPPTCTGCFTCTFAYTSAAIQLHIISYHIPLSRIPKYPSLHIQCSGSVCRLERFKCKAHKYTQSIK
jgi:hypothetical protein